MERITNQKITVLNFLRKTKIHPTAEQVFLEVQKKLPRISQATVYRILDGFVEDGTIKSVTDKNSTNSPTRFDGNEKTHQHFICKKCGNIDDLYNDKIEEYLTSQKSLIKKGLIENFEVNFYGQCSKCKN